MGVYIWLAVKGLMSGRFHASVLTGLLPLKGDRTESMHDAARHDGFFAPGE